MLKYSSSKNRCIFFSVLAAVLVLIALIVGLVVGLRRGEVFQPRIVHAHYLVSTQVGHNTSSFTKEINLARNAGIDVFAVNIANFPNANGIDYQGVCDSFFDAADQTGLKLYLSIDTDSNGFTTDSYQSTLQRYLTRKSYFQLNGKYFVSTFSGTNSGIDFPKANSILKSQGFPIYFAPTFFASPDEFSNKYNYIDALVQWNSWPSGNTTLKWSDYDVPFVNSLAKFGGQYIPGISPWFASYQSRISKVFGNHGFLAVTRWQDIIASGVSQVNVITWNDYAEASYVSPLTDDPQSIQFNQTIYNHGPMLELMSYFITRFKIGAYPQISKDKVYVYYRLSPASATPANLTPGVPLPPDAQTLDDFIYVVSLLTSPGTLTISSGGKQQSFNVGQGLQMTSMPFGVGKQRVDLIRGSSTVVSVAGAQDIVAVPATPNYNYYSVSN